MEEEKLLITKFGYTLLIEEYNNLKNVERIQVTKTLEWARSNGDLSENGDYIYAKKRLREIDERLNYLSVRLSKFQVIDPCNINSDFVEFGATVRVLDLMTDKEQTFVIVGEDEINPSQGLISYKSPIGKALLGKKEGDIVEVETPKGRREFEILQISYIERVAE
ncbi:MAG: transcription elongation factor GreA [Deltaproteobacteria bacterium]|nr:transcription elongation factor GreA [Deltaproteobacteria bacterium]